MKYNVYKIPAERHYVGSSLVAAVSADEANKFIKEFKEDDENNRNDSYGYGYVKEKDVLEDVYSERCGFIDHGIAYTCY